jgi:hypothetical protein
MITLIRIAIAAAVAVAIWPQRKWDRLLEIESLYPDIV